MNAGTARAATQAERKRSLLLLLWLVLLPLLALLALDRCLDRDDVIRWLSHYRPTAGESHLELNVARQMLGADAALRVAAPVPRIAIVGSSSVVNGVDAQAVNAAWRAVGMHAEAINLGQTGLISYELALLRRHVLHPSVVGVVYLYNSFSFGNQLLGSVVGVRWDTREMLALRPFDPADPSSWRQYATGMLNEQLVLLRYGNVIKSVVLRGLSGRLRELPYFQDFPPEERLDEPRPRTIEPEAPPGDWLRAAYVDSERQGDSLGYRGLVRFLTQARERGVRVVLAPVPEPEFGRNNRWRRGVDSAQIDARVAEIAQREGAIFISRMSVAHLEADDTLFRDPTHFNRFGRERYSRELAMQLGDALR